MPEPTQQLRTGNGAGPQRGTTQKMSRVRRTIGARMLDSLHTAAHLTTVVEADVTDVLEHRRRPETAADRSSLLSYLCVAALEAARRHPVVNAWIEDDALTVTYHDQEHLSLAVETPRGLLVPVIRDAGRLDTRELTVAIAEVAARARAGELTAEDMAGGTFTVTNTGSRGALFDTPIINRPQVAILGTGAVVERAVIRRHSDEARDFRVVPRSIIHLALTYDHRLIDGSDAAGYLSTVKLLLARPEELAVGFGR